MRQVFAATVIFLFLSPLLAQNAAPATDTASHVTLPLAEYDRLRDPDRPENITVIDTLHLTGSFKERNLSVTFIGKSVGRHVATPILQTSGGISLWGCSGSAVISRAGDAFRLTPLSDSFSATCRIAAAGSDRLELVSTEDVLAIDSSVGDGELIAGERASDGKSSYSLVRLSAGAGDNLAPTATGYYLITLLPDETRFRYAIRVHNPNRSRRPFEVQLRSGEHLQQVDADAAYEVADGGVYRFDLPPGDLTLVMTGQLSGDSFTPPVEASLQYLAVENHPIVRPVFSGAVKRISAAETGLPIQFRGPQAFLLGRGETIHWKKTKLEALHTVSYALSGTSHKFFIPAEGAVLGESVFAIDNQGASDVQLPLKPEPTYVSIQGEPLLMTKEPDGKLTVPLSAGKQEVVVQHRQGIRHFLGFGFGRLVIPQLTVPSTSLLVAINYPRQWYPLAQAFSTRTKIWLPSTELTLVFLALLLWNERLFSWLGLPLKRRLWLAAALAGAAAAFDTFAIVVTFADGLLSVVWLVPHLKREKWTVLKGLFATAVVVVGLVVFLFTLRTRQRLDDAYTGSGGIASTSEPLPVTGEAKDLMREASQNMSALRLNAAPQQKVDAGNYQGLPARFEIPGGERHSYFGQEMLTTDREHAVTVLLVSSSIVFLLGLIVLAAALLLLWKSRVALREGLRARMAAAGGVVEG
jgi:hypothetical protein